MMESIAYEAEEQPQCCSSSSPGIPPMIDTSTKNEHKIEVSLDSLHIVDDPTSFEKTTNNESLSINDDHTADETFLESPGSSVSNNHTNTNDTLEYDDDAKEVSSTVSEEIIEEGPDFSDDDDETIDSTRMLLKQAQERSEYQSVYEEVKLLRREVSQCRQSIQVTLSQKLELKRKSNSLENQLTQAQEQIQAYKVKELQWYEDGAEREKEYMNQLDEMCSTAKSSEEELKAEIVERDMRIIEMQNMLNEKDLKRINAVREENMNESNTVKEYEEETETSNDDVHYDDEDSSSDAESCSFI